MWMWCAACTSAWRMCTPPPTSTCASSASSTRCGLYSRLWWLMLI